MTKNKDLVFVGLAGGVMALAAGWVSWPALQFSREPLAILNLPVELMIISGVIAAWLSVTFSLKPLYLVLMTTFLTLVTHALIAAVWTAPFADFPSAIAFNLFMHGAGLGRFAGRLLLALVIAWLFLAMVASVRDKKS